MAEKNSTKALVVVESPAKAKTINKYLGSNFEVKASVGHIRDLPSKGLNVDIENNFEPTYDIMPGKKRTLNSLKSAAKKCDTLYLATDLDREGEAIAWHISEMLKFDPEKTYRVVFNAITKKSIQDAFSEPGKLNMNKVMAQQARRILDRIVGYQISPLLWKKVSKGLSAGRVQSVAVKMVVEREREIRAFNPKPYWLIPAVFTTDLNLDCSEIWKQFLGDDEKNRPTVSDQNKWLSEHDAFRAELKEINGQKFVPEDKDLAFTAYEILKGADFKVSDYKTKQTQSRPAPPFITSSLQQTAANKLGFATKRTMRLAQNLYEGIELGAMGSVGLITYMRSDSTYISPEAFNAARTFIGKEFGDEYVPEKPNFFTSAKNAQQAHEAIRPTDPALSPEFVKPHLTAEQYKLYDLIWRRFVACQMSNAKWNITTIDIKAQNSGKTGLYRSAGRQLVFDGFTKVWHTSSNEQRIPELETDQQLRPVDISLDEKWTKPPARYTEGSLVKALENQGIGRPSTYASIISTIQDRNYVEQRERKFHATDLGEVVTDKLSEFFPQIMDMDFTRLMEQKLDNIEDQHSNWVGVLNDFYGPFKENLDNALEQMKHAKAETQPSDYKCPECGAELVYRFGRNGRFLSCSTYPECKFAAPVDKDGKILEEKPSGIKCPNCGKNMIEKNGRYGKFLGCEDYPQCKTIMRIGKDGNPVPPKAPPEPTGIKCYKCAKGELVIRDSKRGKFLGCNKFPRCRTIVKLDHLEKLKELQAAGKWPPENEEKAKEILKANADAAKKEE
ncbi:DNA topoisomerase 1 [Limihaloglobus sulfuriphilus]|uniref:DNA topoisomerase 1 n=1 Tax=Limihaloglobus sulfuriphilus TaxID=1851148 RepID=A0A1Q2ME23_9BACT|nr:type I DNA topoisomerase [Limihaloglobus sulfuriphilus]AQQ70788.1 DNA topoisomerase 1 [Limihaloglobus sulfuriphilus]